MIDIFKDGFFTGMNYWGSKSAINMWNEYDGESIDEDLRLLSEAGITHLRVFPLWPTFQPLKAIYGPQDVYEYGLGEDPLPDTPAGRAGVSEEACLKFENFLGICEKHGMKLIVALITGHMSYRTYCPPAFEGKALLSDPTVMKWQIKFVKYFVGRFKNAECIVGWDLGNEPVNMPGGGKNPDAFYIWCNSIADAIRVTDSTRPVVSGLDNAKIETGYSNLKMIGDVMDVNTTHPYNIFSTKEYPLTSIGAILDGAFRCRLSEDISGKPTFPQEFGAIGYLNCSRKTEADFYRAALLSGLAHGCHGTMWWCAFDQGQHTFAPYRWNNIGSDYGFFDKDLRPKQTVEVNKEFKKLLEKLPGGELPKHKSDGVILIPREEGDWEQLLRATYVLAKKANLDMSFSYLLDPIPDAPLYIIPSIEKNKAVTKQRLDELLEKVKAGSVLYLCADTGLFRQIPEIMGVEFAYREQVNCEKKMVLRGVELPIRATFSYKPESSRAEVVAVDENGDGVLFKQACGKGTVYFMTLPIEAHLAKNSKLLYANNAPKYDLVYRGIAKCAKISRIADSSDPLVRLTEHEAEDGSIFVFAINYSGEERCAKLTVKDGFKIDSAIHGDMPTDGAITLRECDGAIFKITKTK